MKDLLRTQTKIMSRLERKDGEKHSNSLRFVKKSLVAAYVAEKIPLPRELRAPYLDQIPQAKEGRLRSVVLKKRKKSADEDSHMIQRQKRHVVLEAPDPDMVELHAPSDFE